MTAYTAERPTPRVGMIGGLLILCAATALGIAVLAGGKLALAALIGLIAFGFFVREPVWGLYMTTALLLLSGLGATIGSVQASVPAAAAKACGAATVAAWFVNLSMRKHQFRLGRESVLIGFFLLWALFGIGNSAVWNRQLPEWARLVTLAFYFVLAINLLDTPRKLHVFVLLILACGVVMSIFAVIQYKLPSLQFSAEGGLSGVASGVDKAYVDYESVRSGPAVRVSGGAGHSNWLAMTMLMILPLNAYWFSISKSWRGKSLASIAVLLELTALVLTFTRLGLVVGIAVALFMVGKRLLRLNPYRATALAVALLCAWFALPAAYKERVVDFTQYRKSQSTDARMALQEYAWEYIQDEPLAGEGIGGYGLRFQGEDHWVAANLRYLIEWQGWNPVYYGPHNLYLQLGAETGLVGLCMMLLLLGWLLRDAQKTEKVFTARGNQQAAFLGGALLVSMLSFMFCGIFLHALFQKIWWMIAAAIVAYRFLPDRIDAQKKQEPQPS
ncbi:MAG: hypothetical protein GY851_21965 [bacterium]|nr:hypothetical protein [bacterium]